MKAVLIFLLSVCSYQLAMSQAYPDRHSTNWDDAWVSCETNDSPNAKRDPGHWIMYDLGDQYALQQSTIWNNNVPGETARGFNQVVIDVSNDGEEWTELGTYNFTEGPGSTIYQGDEGPDFGGTVARYVLVSALSNYGGNCYSLSEIKINAAITTTTSFAASELGIAMQLTPNPATTSTTVTIEELPAGTVQYQLTDARGRLHQSGMVTDRTMQLDLTSLATGTYTFTVYNEQGLQSQLLNVVTPK